MVQVTDLQKLTTDFHFIKKKEEKTYFGTAFSSNYF